MALKCRGCEAPIFFARTKTGALMPINVGETPGSGNIILQNGLDGRPTAIEVEAGQGRYTSHFATCPHAKSFRRK